MKIYALTRPQPQIKLLISVISLGYCSLISNAEPANHDAKFKTESTRLQAIMPTSGFNAMAKQHKHSLGGMTTPKTEIALYPFNLGPTGILAERHTDTMSYKVVKVASGSPADGKINEGDIIIGANNRIFDQFDAPEASRRRFPNV